MIRCIQAVVTSAMLMGLFALPTQAATLTGNPETDGWTFQGNNLDNGVYVRGQGTFSYDIYTTGFTLDASYHTDLVDSLWQDGDEIIGMGGVFVDYTAAEANWGAFTTAPYNAGDGVAVNDDISTSARFISKFGTSTSSFSTSSEAPWGTGGNGEGSLSGGFGGDGSILASFQGATLGGAGTVADAGNVERYGAGGGVGVNLTAGRYARYSYTWSNQYTTGHVGTWEMMLNLSLLERGTSYGLYPELGDDAVQTVQRGTNRFSDGLVTTGNSAVVPIPEPATLSLLGFALIAAVRKARKRA